jgi:hypothetical protein
VAIALVAVAAAAVFGIQRASAGGRPVGPTLPATRPEQGVQPANVSGLEKLKSVVMSNGDVDSFEPAGFVPVDSAFLIKCPGTKTCTFTDDGIVQAGDLGSSWAICFEVDGQQSPIGCPTQDLGGAGFTIGSISATFPGLKPGDHTVQTVVFFPDPDSLYSYDLKYGVYTP